MPPIVSLVSSAESTFFTLILCSILAASCSTPELRLGDQLAQQGEWDRAVAAYREAVKKEPFDSQIQQRLAAAKIRAAELHYAEGRRCLEENRMLDAVREFKLALGLDPSRVEHHTGMNEALRLKQARDQLQAGEKYQSLGRVEDALEAFERAVELDPNLAPALAGITDITKQLRAAKGYGGTPQPITLRFQNAKLKEVFEILARTAGVNVIFDKDIRDDPITIFIKDLPFEDALNLILNTNGMTAQRVAPDTLLILPNNKQKQAQYQDLLMRTFYLANAKAKDAVNLVRTMLESKRLYVDEKVNAIVVRDEPAKLQLAERLLFAIDRRDPEVELDLEVLEVNRTKSLKYGLNFAKQAGSGVIPSLSSGGISTATTPFTYRQLTSIGPESYLFTMPASVLIDFFKQESEAKTLASPKLRVVTGKSASINVGDKQPILLSTTNVLPGQAATGAVPTTSTVTSIEFKDTGVKLTVEPTINVMDEVTLKLKVEVTRLGDQVTLQASPEIKQFKFGTRAAETVLTMQDDETVVLAGLIQDEDRKTKSSVPLLGDIPLLGHLFTSTTEDRVATEVVLTITPHIVRNLSTPPIAAQSFWSGTEATFAVTQLFPPHAVPVSQSLQGITLGAKGQMKEVGDGERATPHSRPAGYRDPEAPEPMRQFGELSPAKPGNQIAQGDPATGTQASGSSTPSASPVSPTGSAPVVPSPVVVARGPGLLVLKPTDLSVTVGQEFRIDLTATERLRDTEAVVTIGFDPQVVEFRRIIPGVASISARATDNQVILTLRRPGGVAGGESVLAMLFFQAKAQGEFPLVLQGAPNGGIESSISAATSERALVHVR